MRLMKTQINLILELLQRSESEQKMYVQNVFKKRSVLTSGFQ
jgi:hypothetical protein